MRNIEVVSQAIANAIRASGKGSITTEAMKAAMAETVKASDADDLVDNLAVWGNLSALNQELERHGLIHRERAMPALLLAVKGKLA